MGGAEYIGRSNNEKSNNDNHQKLDVVVLVEAKKFKT